MSDTPKPSARRLVLTKIIFEFETGETTEIDPRMVQVIDRKSGMPLFNEVVEG